ncbi:uncharacterized protein LOC107263547 [Cephus cinctus]|uniref:Uncharacterized protein LOC107263547 n=1 Tax=Cephus cinctus TaxID=211228 RepID=A0AAJ7FDG6_CEPCN|nr:uncharacterized protein LOC107263547 [Cephus cinctus]
MILPKSNGTGDSTKLQNIAYYNFVMIIVKNIYEFLNQLDRLASLHLWNPRSKHLVLIQDVTNVTVLKLIFVECWKRKTLNIAVIVQGHDKVYTYNPYLENYLETVSPSQTYYDKIKDMNGHEICTEYIPYIGEQVAQYVKETKSYKFYGKDYGYLESFFTAANARPHYKNLSNETISLYTYFPYRYNFWKVRRFEDVELWFTFFVTDSVFESRTEQIYPLQSNNVCIMAPKSGPKIPNVFNPYRPVIWMCIVLSMLACGIVNYAYNKYNKIPENGFFNAFGIFIGYNLPKRYLTYRERMVLFNWSMCSLLLMGAYQGSLYRFLTILDYYPEIDTLDELYRRNVSVYSYDSFVDILRKYIPKDVGVFSLGDNNYQLYMKENRQNAYASPYSIATYMCKAKIVSENGTPFYHLMKECPIPMFVTYFLPYGSPYLDALNRVTIACREAGLDLFWSEQANLYALLTGSTIMTTDHSKSRSFFASPISVVEQNGLSPRFVGR